MFASITKVLFSKLITNSINNYLCVFSSHKKLLLYFFLFLLDLSFFVVIILLLLRRTRHIKDLINFDLIFIHYLPCRSIALHHIIFFFVLLYRYRLALLPFLPNQLPRVIALMTGLWTRCTGSCWGLQKLSCGCLLRDARLILLSESFKFWAYFLALRLLLLFKDYFTDAAFHVRLELTLLNDSAANLTVSSLWPTIGNVLIEFIIHLGDHKLAIFAHLRLHDAVIVMVLHHKPFAIKVHAVFALNLNWDKSEENYLRCRATQIHVILISILGWPRYISRTLLYSSDKLIREDEVSGPQLAFCS